MAPIATTTEVEDEAVNPALVGAHSHFPTLVRAVMAMPSLRAFGPVTRRLASGRRLNLSAFCEEVAVLVDEAIERAGFEGRLTSYLETDLDPDGDLGCDFKGLWLDGVGRVITFSLSTDDQDTFFPVHVFCRRDGAVFIAVMEEDDSLTFSGRHTLERSEAMVADVVGTLVRLFPVTTYH